MRSLFVVSLVCGSAVLAVGPARADVVVTPSSMNGWSTILFDDGVNPVSATATFVNGIGSPPLGAGSLQLTTGAYGDGASRIRTSNFDGVPLASITSMGYSSYTQAASYSGLHIYMSVRLDYNNDGSTDDVLFFEPEYQNGYTNAVPTQADAVTGQWQSWDARNGGWWSAFDTLGTGNAGANVLPLSAFLALNPGATIVGDFGTSPGIRVTAGFGAPTWDNFVGYVDDFHITIAGGPAIVYDFEPIPTPGAAAIMGLAALVSARRRR